jgi:hypothetical protein
MSKAILPVLLLTVYGLSGQAQTNPAPFNLSAGDFTFTEWSAEAAAGSAPANMAFHLTTDPTGLAYDVAANGTGDWNCAYNLTARNRFFGHGTNGIAMRATGSPQYDDCTSGAAAETRYVGAVVVALNTTGRNNVTVTWTAGTVTVGDGIPQPRITALRMQYRVGTAAMWSDFPTIVEYATQTEGASQDLTTTLPAMCENQPVVQVRWIYYQQTVGQGTRPELRLDDVTISSSASGGTGIGQTANSKALTAYPNPSENGLFVFSRPVSGTVVNVIGVEIQRLKNTDRLDLSKNPSGVYMLHTDRGNVLRLMR